MRHWGTIVAQDIRYAVRISRRQLMFTVAAVGTLALGIGATTAIFSVVDHIVFRPLNYADPGRLFVVHEVVSGSGRTTNVPVKLTHFKQWRSDVRAIEGGALLSGARLTLTGAAEPERVAAARASAGLFSLLGVQPQLGRVFVDADEQPGHDHVVMLSDSLWRSRFAADPNIVGRTVTLEGEPHQVIGVLPASFTFPRLSDLYPVEIGASEEPRLWKPLAPTPGELDPGAGYNYACVVKLAPGVSPSQALSQLNAAQAALSTTGQRDQLQTALVPLLRQITGRSRAGLTLLLVAVATVLLIGCVNISNLLLARTIGRRRELALRAAIGASRSRLAVQLLVEAVCLALVGGALGVVIAYQLVHLIVIAAAADLPRITEVTVDGRVLLFTTAASLFAGLLVGILPAWRLTRGDSAEALKLGPASGANSYATKAVRSFLVSLEVGLSAMCLLTGGLLLASLNQLLSVDVGFKAQQVVTVNMSPSLRHYSTPESRTTFVETVLEGVRRIPGVTSTGVANQLPLTGEGGNAVISAEGAAPEGRPLADLRVVSPDYLQAMGIPLRMGRLFAATDRDHNVALVSALTAERLWPQQSPLGKRLRFGPPSNPAIDVVGVVGDVRGVSLDRKPSFTVYLPVWQPLGPRAPRSFDLSLVVRTTGDPGSASAAVRRVVRDVDPELPLGEFRTMSTVIEKSVGQRRFTTMLVLLFAIAATLLASLGIYGVVSYSVAQRTHEMGIRLALGARPGQIRRLVMLQSLWSVTIGLIAGLLVAALGLNRVLGAMLFGIHATDPWMLVTVAAVILGVGVLATHVPAQQATRVDPLRSLRQE